MAEPPGVTRCYHCHHRFDSLRSTIMHAIEVHPTKELCVLIKTEARNYKSHHYDIFAETLCDKKEEVNEETFQVV